MKTEAEIRAYTKELKDKEKVLDDLLRSPDVEDSKKEDYYQTFLIVQYVENALEWALDEFPHPPEAIIIEKA